jgi:hypothetical protein
VWTQYVINHSITRAVRPVSRDLQRQCFEKLGVEQTESWETARSTLMICVFRMRVNASRRILLQ